MLTDFLASPGLALPMGEGKNGDTRTGLHQTFRHWRTQHTAAASDYSNFPFRAEQ
ncbi:MAG: hypothetical protein J7463_03620 [Roseiflexus sp.]|nr:hypothetical protein [Roseiflexus sp.]MBO9334296.1 hypothetical protein [Roseiflexus sp.]MBO9341429.1 hypothetical protein [Roseiflexus sp.]MBO9365158.1 hypothetical protein [Roseiflexus sp.]MBO9382860.1 hypothetical protein [Roseiflexus sp.]